MTSWIVLQLADSAFPTGGFAHSGGLEALVAGGEVVRGSDVERFCGEHVDQTAQSSLPIVGAVWSAPERHASIDAHASATLWSHVAARASRSQGRSLLDVAARTFSNGTLDGAKAALARGDLEGHLAPAWGLVTRALVVSRDEALATFLHLSVRGVLSAGVRLGVVGPTEAQAMTFRLSARLDRALAHARSLRLADVAQTAPLIELFQATHDRLYSRLFQS